MRPILYSGKSIYECPKCHHYECKIDDSRDNDSMNVRVRRRVCSNCGCRWHTAEICIEDAEDLEKRRNEDPEIQAKGLSNYLDILLDERNDVISKMQELELTIVQTVDKIKKGAH